MRTALTTLLLFFFLSTFGQISTIKVVDKDELIEKMPYDSLCNYPGKSVYGLKGQQLYLKAKPYDARQFGYEGFILDYTKPGGWNKENIYKCSEAFLGADSYRSKYDELSEKYFNVLEVYKHPKVEQDYKTFGHLYYLKLKETSSGDELYFEYNNTHPHFFPFLVVGFAEKQKQMLNAKKYVLRGKNNLSAQNIVNINTGDRIFPKSNTIWKFVNVGVEEKNYYLALVLKNDKNEVIALNIESYPWQTWVTGYEEAEKQRKDYGELNYRRIIDGKVADGMTKEMCLLAWGKPEYSRPYEHTFDGDEEPTELEEWIYGTNRLFFKEGRLIDFK